MPQPPFQPNQPEAFRYSRHVGNYASAAELPNTAGATVQTPRLKVGSVAFSIADGSLFCCSDATEGAATWTMLAAAAGNSLQGAYDVGQVIDTDTQATPVAISGSGAQTLQTLTKTGAGEALQIDDGSGTPTAYEHDGIEVEQDYELIAEAQPAAGPAAGFDIRVTGGLGGADTGAGGGVGGDVFGSAGDGGVDTGANGGGGGSAALFGGDGADAAGGDAGTGGSSSLDGGVGGDSDGAGASGTGGSVGVTGGIGGAASGAIIASPGGSAAASGGAGGAGSAGAAAGPGGDAGCVGGAAGADGGGGGSDGGDVTLTGGAASGAGTDGRVVNNSIVLLSAGAVFTVATLPSVTPAGQIIQVSDETGGPVPAYSDGTNWRRFSDGVIVS